MMKRAFLVALLLGANTAFAETGEKVIKRADVPKAVLDAIAARYPKVQMVAFAQADDNEKPIYEVQLKVEGVRVEVSLLAEGQLISEERTITMKEVPEAVQKKVATSRYAKGKVRRVEKVTMMKAPEEPQYEILVEDAGTRRELLYTAAGELMKDEAKKPGHRD